MKKSLLFISLFIFYASLAIAQVTVRTDASPKTGGGVTFTLSGDARVDTDRGTYAFSNQLGILKTATVAISKAIYVNSLNFSWGINVQGSTVEIYSGSTMLMSFNWPSNGTRVNINKADVTSIVFKDNGNSNNGGLGELSEINFISPATAPTVTTTEPSSITSNSATLGGNVTSDGDDPVTERGVVYAQSVVNPEIGVPGVTKVSNGDGTGVFSATISGLTGNTYYAKAYAKNQIGTSYGNVYSFTMKPNVAVTTTNLTAVSTTYGSASTTSNSSIDVNGTNLIGNVLVTAPTGFEVSTGANGFYSGSVTLLKSGSTVSGSVYIRLAATTSAGNHSGDITVSSIGASDVAATIPSSTVNRRSITVTINPSAVISKTYNKSNVATLASTNYTLNGLLSGDNSVSVTGTATYDNGNVGTGKTVTVGDFILTGSASANYSLSTETATTSGVITQKLLTLILKNTPAITKVYDQTNGASLAVGNYSLSGVETGDVVSVSGTATYDNANVGAGKFITVNSFVLTGSSSGNYSIAGTPLTTTGAITQKTLTLQLNISPAITKVYNGSNSASLAANSYKLNGVVSGDEVSVSGTATYDNANVGASKLVTVVSFVLSGAASANYSLSTETATIAGAITRKPLGLALSSMPAITKVYDRTNTASIAAANYTLTGVEAADRNNISVSGTATYDDANVGTDKGITVGSFVLAGSAGANYSLPNVNLSTLGAITQKALTLTVNNTTAITKVYDRTNTANLAPANYALTGVVTGDDVVVSGTATYNNANVGTGKLISVGAFVLSGGASGNYSLSTLSATTSGAITQKALTLALDNTTAITKVYDQTNTASLAAVNYVLTGVQTGDDVSASGTATYENANVGINKIITASGFVLSGGSSANYSVPGTVLTTTGAITQKALTLALNNTTAITKVYDQTNTASLAASNYTLTGILPSDEVSVSGTASYDNANVGSGKTITVGSFVLSGGASGNYSLPNVTLTTSGAITQAPLIITATGPSKTYGTGLSVGTSTTNFTVTGTLPAGQTVTGVTLTPTASGLSAGTPVGSIYSVTPSSAMGTGGFLASNYNINYVPFHGIVSPAALTITATGPVKIYGTALTVGTNSTNFAVNGALPSGQTVTSVTLTPDAAGLSATTAAGSAYTVTPSLATGTGGFLASNYNITYKPFNGTVSQAGLSIAATGPSKVYGTALTAGTSTNNFTVTGALPAGQAVTGVTLTPDAAGLSATTAAGSAYTVTPSLATGRGGFLVNNYNITYVPFNGTVSQAGLSIAATGPSKVYGTALTTGTSTTNFAVTGALPAGQTVTSVTLTPDAAGLSATTAAGSAYTVTPSLATGTGGFLSNNYNITYVPFNGMVGQAVLTIAATGSSKVYGMALTTGTSTTNFAVTGALPAGQTVTSVTLTPDAAGLSVTTAAGSAYTVTPSLATGTGGFLASNYNITYTPFNGMVSQAGLSIAATGLSKVYGTALTAGTSTTNFTVTGALPVGQTVTGVTLTPDAAGLSVATAAGSAYMVTPSLAMGTGGFLASNYNITYTPFNGTVSQAGLTIAATGPSKVYGTALTAGTSTTNFTVTGALPAGQAVTGVTLTPDAEGLSSTTAAGSAYVVTPSLANGTGGFLSNNYNITYVPFNGTVSQAVLSIAATGPSKVYGTALTAGTSTTNFAVTGALLAGQMVTGVTLTPNAAGLSPTTAAGSAYTVTPSLATGTGGFLASNYNITYTPFNGTVSQAALTITASNVNKTYGQVLTSAGSSAFTSIGLKNGETIDSVTVVYGTEAAANAAVGTYAGSVVPSAATSGSFTSSNYDISYVPGNIIIVARPITVTATAKSKVYGDAEPSLTYTYTGTLVASDNFSGSLTRVAGENVGSYAINRGTLTAGNNYSINYVGANMAISKAVLTITANNAVMCQGNNLPTFGVSYSGFKFSDNETSLSTKPTVTTTATRNTAAGNYVLTANGAASGNYTFAYVNGQLTINALPVVVITSNSGLSVSKGATVQLTASGGTSYSWSNASGIISGQNTAVLTVRPSQTTTYTVTATNANGCSQGSSVTIEVVEDYMMISGTNILTPNGDGRNDYLVIRNIDMYPNSEIKIFDIAGRLVYSKKSYDNSWDGTFNGSPLAKGTYYYIVDFADGKAKRKGFVSIVRD